MTTNETTLEFEPFRDGWKVRLSTGFLLGIIRDGNIRIMSSRINLSVNDLIAIQRKIEEKP